jgi:hypothetical protein
MDANGQPLGTLNLYAATATAGAFGAAALIDGSAYALQAGVALARAAEHDQLERLREAVATNRVIGTAMGCSCSPGGSPRRRRSPCSRSTASGSTASCGDIAAELVRGWVRDRRGRRARPRRPWSPGR